MFEGLARLALRWPWLLLAAGLAVMAAGGSYGARVIPLLKNEGFQDPAAESSRAAAALQQDLGRSVNTLVLLFSAKDGLTVDQPEYRRAVDATLATVRGRSGVTTVTTFYDGGGPQFVSTDRTRTFAVIGLAGGQDEQLTFVQQVRPLLKSDRLDVRVGGMAGIADELSTQAREDLERADAITFPVLAVLLIFVYGSVVAAALPLIMGAFAIMASFLVLRIASTFTDISIFALNIIIMLGLGLAIDYSLFIVSRFREELMRQGGHPSAGSGQAVAAALHATLATAGRTVFFSGVTVSLSLFGLLFYPLMFLRSVSLGAAAAVAASMVGSLICLPAVLAILGPRVNRWSVWTLRHHGLQGAAAAAPGAAAAVEPRGFWYRVASFSMRWPVAVLVCAAVPLIAAGLPFLRANFTSGDARALPANRDGRYVAETMAATFPRNESDPIQVVVHTGGSSLSASNVGALFDYTRRLQALPGVRRVDSLVTLDPRLDKAAYQALYANPAQAPDPRIAQAAQALARGEYTVVNVLYDTHPLSPESRQLAQSIRAVPPPAGASALVGGPTARLTDLIDTLGVHTPQALLFIALVVFVLLFLMLGSIVVPLKALVMNALSLSASFGALVFIFQDGHLARWLDFTPTGGVDTTLPVLLVAIAFGLSMDYEVFLLSRMKEQFDRSGDMGVAVFAGVQKTGRIVTSAALMMLVVFAAFATSGITVVKEIGVGLGLAVMIDATLVRMLIVPAAMRLMGTLNWWAPAPLAALHRRLGLGETEPAPRVALAPTTA